MSSKRFPRSLTPTLSACLPLLLTGCATSIEAVPPHLPAPPPALVACAEEIVPAIPGAAGSPLSKVQAAETIGDQRAAALAKDRCAKGWQAFYADVGQSLTAENPHP